MQISFFGPGSPIDGERLEWLVDGAPIGVGRTASITLESGDHELTLVARAEREGQLTIRIRALRLEEAGEPE